MIDISKIAPFLVKFGAVLSVMGLFGLLLKTLEAVVLKYDRKQEEFSKEWRKHVKK